LLSPEGVLLAEGEALCVMLADEHIEKFKAVRAQRAARRQRD